MDVSILEEIGLTKSEITLYLTLLKLGSSKSGKITKEVDLHRSRVYESLNRLMEKGLVSYVIKNNVKYFEAIPPQRLLSYVEEQKNELNEKEERIKELIPKIEQSLHPLKPEAEAHVFLGIEGFKTIRKDVLKDRKDLYLIGGKGKEDKVLRYFYPQFDKERIKKRIRWHALFDYETEGKALTKSKLMESKFLPKGYSSPVVVNIYGDKVVNVLWKGDYPLCFMIKNKDVANTYRKWFELLWEKS